MIYASTQPGVGKVVNEDRLLIGASIVANDYAALDVPREGYVCVADGVGGNAGGAEASQYLVEALLNNPDIVNLNKPEEIRDRLLRINRQLIDYAVDLTDKPTMASTLTGVLLGTSRTFLFHVGNTRAYALQGGYLKQLTEDHTTKRFLEAMKRTEEAASANPAEIIACFGGGKESLAQRLIVKEVLEQRTILLTSDGIHESVSLDYLEETLNSDRNGMAKTELILDAALAADTQDDLSVVIIDFD